MARVKTTDTGRKVVKKHKIDDDPPSKESSIPVKEANSVDDETLNKDGGQENPKKRKKPTGNVQSDMDPKVEMDESLVLDDTAPSRKQYKTLPRTNVAQNKTSGQLSTRKCPKAEEGTVGTKDKKPRKVVQVTETPFRSSLGGLVTFIKGLNLRECHKEVLTKTPFWGIFEAIMENRLTNAQCRKSDKLIIEIIETYDPTREKFRLGRSYLEIRREDMVRIFGIHCGEEFVSLRSGNKEAIKFVARREIEEERMTTTSVKQLLTAYVGRDETDYVQDVARLLCLLLFHTFFFPTGTTVKWVHLAHAEELDKMMDYDWNGAIIKELMTSIRKYHREPRKVTGCVMALLYWLCEHTTLAKAIHPEHPMGIVKWSLPDVVAKSKKISLKDLKRNQVVAVLENEPGTEPKEVPVGIVNIQDGKEVDESSMQLPSHIDDASEGDVHRVDEAMTAPFDNTVSADGGHPVSTDQGFKSIGECELSGIKLNDEYGSFIGNDDGPSIFGNARKIRELQELISTMEEEAKVRNETHAMEMKKKDEVIASMNETILELLAENDRFFFQVAEPEVHEVTQSVRALSVEDQQRTLIRNIKAKWRKGTEKEDYFYPENRKRKDPVELDGGMVKDPIINVDDHAMIQEKQGSKPDPIKGLKTNKVHRKMTSADQNKLAQFWNEATNSTSMWCGTISGCNVYAEDMRSLIMDTAITGNVIDAYSEFLLMEQERSVAVLTKHKDDGGSTQGGGTLTSYVFTSCFLTLMAGKSNEERREILWNMLPSTSAYRYLLFPIHHNFHLTLLALDNEEGSWNFYNSMRPRHGFDINLEAAKQLKIQVENYYKETNGLLCTQECQDIAQVEDCPQQASPSLDYGIILCHIIRQYFRMGKVGPKFLKDDCRAMRAEIIHAFLNDELFSWSSSQHMVDAGNKDPSTEHATGGGEEYKKSSRTRNKK